MAVTRVVGQPAPAVAGHGAGGRSAECLVRARSRRAQERLNVYLTCREIGAPALAALYRYAAVAVASVSSVAPSSPKAAESACTAPSVTGSCRRRSR